MKTIVIGARRWLVLGTVLLAGATFGGIALHGCITAPPSPPAAPACNDAVAVGEPGGIYNCNAGEVVEVRPLDGSHALVICRCPRPEPAVTGRLPLTGDVTAPVGAFLKNVGGTLEFVQ